MFAWPGEHCRAVPLPRTLFHDASILMTDPAHPADRRSPATVSFGKPEFLQSSAIRASFHVFRRIFNHAITVHVFRGFDSCCVIMSPPKPFALSSSLLSSLRLTPDEEGSSKNHVGRSPRNRIRIPNCFARIVNLLLVSLLRLPV
jgi:hypothetical protein